MARAIVRGSAFSVRTLYESARGREVYEVLVTKLLCSGSPSDLTGMARCVVLPSWIVFAFSYCRA
jgi:hypothetical protein